MRYTNATILTSDNIRYYKGKIYPQIPFSEDDIYVIATDTDRLDTIANLYYGDSSLWWIISVANSNVISQGTIFVAPGTQLRIPTNMSKVLEQYKQINTAR